MCVCVSVCAWEREDLPDVFPRPMRPATLRVPPRTPLRASWCTCRSVSNRLFKVLDLYWRVPESGGLWFKSRKLKRRSGPNLRAASSLPPHGWTYLRKFLRTCTRKPRPESGRDYHICALPRQALRTSIKSQFVKILINFGDKCLQNGSKNELTAPRTSLG